MALGVTQHEVNRLARLVGDLQQLSLADESKLRLDLFELVLDDITDAAIEAFNSQAAEADVALASEGQAPEPISVDANRIRQAIDNLIANAIRHTPPGGQVTVRTTRLRFVSSRSRGRIFRRASVVPRTTSRPFSSLGSILNSSGRLSPCLSDLPGMDSILR